MTIVVGETIIVLRVQNLFFVFYKAYYHDH